MLARRHPWCQQTRPLQGTAAGRHTGDGEMGICTDKAVKAKKREQNKQNTFFLEKSLCVDVCTYIRDIYSAQEPQDKWASGLHSSKCHPQSQGCLRSDPEAAVCELLSGPQDEANAIMELSNSSLHISILKRPREHPTGPIVKCLISTTSNTKHKKQTAAGGSFRNMQRFLVCIPMTFP